VNRIAAFEGITIETIRSISRSEVGTSEDSVVPVDGDAKLGIGKFGFLGYAAPCGGLSTYGSVA